MHIKPEHIYTLVGFVSTVVGLWASFSAKIKQKIKNYLAKVVEDEELLEELTKED